MSLFSSLFNVVLPAFIVMGVGVMIGRLFRPDLQLTADVTWIKPIP